MQRIREPGSRYAGRAASRAGWVVLLSTFLWSGSQLAGQILQGSDPAERPPNPVRSRADAASGSEQAAERFAVAAGHYRLRNWEAAARELARFASEFPDDPQAPDALFFGGEALAQLKRHAEAQRAFAELLRRTPGHRYASLAQFRLGESAYLAGEVGVARDALQAFRLRGSQDRLRATYAAYYLGELAVREGHHQAAVELFLEGLRGDPGSKLAADFRLGLGRAYQALGQLGEARRFLAALAAQEGQPLADDAQLQLALLHRAEGQGEAALDALETLRERFPTSPLLSQAAYWQGRQLIELQRYQAAVDLLGRTLPAEPSNAQAARIAQLAGEAYRALGRPQAAKSMFEHALRASPDTATAAAALQSLAALAWSRDEHARIGELYEQTRSLAADEARAARRDVGQLWGRSLLKLRRPAEATAVFSDLLSEAGREPAAHLPELRYYLAVSELAAGQAERAIATLDRLGSSPPAGIAAGVQLTRGSALFELGRYDEAVRALRACLGQRAADASEQLPEAALHRSRLQLWISLAETTRWDELQAELERFEATELDEETLETIRYLADAARAAETHRLASRCYQWLVRESNPSTYVRLGLAGQASLARLVADHAAEDTGRDRTAGGALADRSGALEALMRRFPDRADTAEAAMQQAGWYVRRERGELALPLYQFVITRHPRSPWLADALLNAGVILETLEQDREAVTLLTRYLAEFPDHQRRDQGLYVCAWALTDSGQASRVQPVLAELVRQYPDSRYWPDACYRLARLVAEAGERDWARQLLEGLAAGGCGPRIHAHALLLQGNLAVEAGDIDEASVALRKLVEIYPDSDLYPSALYWLAECEYQQGRYRVAGELLDRLERQQAVEQRAWSGMVTLRRAQLLAHDRQWAAARELAETVGQRYPEFARGYEADYLIGRCLAAEGRLDEARGAYRRALSAPAARGTETAAIAEWMIGETYFHQRRYDQAIEAYTRVLQLYAFPQWHAAALLQAGKCHEVQGQWDDANFHYQQLLRSYGSSPYANSARRRLSVVQVRQESASAAADRTTARTTRPGSATAGTLP